MPVVMSPTRPVRRSLAWVGGLLAVNLLALSAQAAGGHHAVDDANMLEAGHCSLENWVERQTQGDRTLVHGGSTCRVGPVELGLNLEREKFKGLDAKTVLGPQLKWAYGLTPGLSIGVVAGASFNTASARFAASSVVLPLTWRFAPSLAAHANWGRDLVRGGPDLPRAGLALELSPTKTWSLVGERFVQAQAHSTRLGGRWTVTPGLSVDLSRARTLGGAGPSWVTVGLNWELQRPLKTSHEGPGIPPR